MRSGLGMRYGNGVRVFGAVVVVLGLASGCAFRVDPLASGAGGGSGADGGGGGGMGSPDLGSVSSLPDLASPAGPFLTVTSVLSPAIVDLTGEGTSDWAHWGINDSASFDHRAVGGLISDFTQTSLNLLGQYADSAVAHRWTDGLAGVGHHPNSPAKGSSTGVYVLSGGFALSAPADGSPRRLRLYVAQLHATGQLEVSLSDGSAKTVIDASHTAGDSTVDVEYIITYAAAAAGQTLDMRWTLASATFGGIVALQSATLQPF